MAVTYQCSYANLSLAWQDGSCHSNLAVTPFYRGFTGGVELSPNATSYVTVGKARKIGNNQIHVSELPVGMWTQKFKEKLQVCALRTLYTGDRLRG